jgi:alkaline phosphatase
MNPPKNAGTRRPPVKINHLITARVIKLLTEECVTYYEIIEETGVSYQTALKLMRALRAENLAHIGGWEKDRHGRENIPVFSWGKGKDKPRACMSQTERARLYRGRLKQRAMGLALAGPLPSRHDTQPTARQLSRGPNASY